VTNALTINSVLIRFSITNTYSNDIKLVRPMSI